MSLCFLIEDQIVEDLLLPEGEYDEVGHQLLHMV